MYLSSSGGPNSKLHLFVRYDINRSGSNMASKESWDWRQTSWLKSACIYVWEKAMARLNFTVLPIHHCFHDRRVPPMVISGIFIIRLKCPFIHMSGVPACYWEFACRCQSSNLGVVRRGWSSVDHRVFAISIPVHQEQCRTLSSINWNAQI